MSFLSRIFGKSKKIQEATISIIGPTKSGKTTFVRYLETGEPVTQELHTTLGIELRHKSAKVDNWSLTAVDTGGQEIYQQTFWELAVQQADVVIFMIDATIKPESNLEFYNLSKEQFAYALDIVPPQIPLLVLLNKQDLKDMNPMQPEEAIGIFNKDVFANRTVAYLPISAKFGDGVDDALGWIIEKLERR